MFDAPDIADRYVRELKKADAIARGTDEVVGMDGADPESMLLAYVASRPEMRSLLLSIELAPGQLGAAAQRTLHRTLTTLKASGASAAEPQPEQSDTQRG